MMAYQATPQASTGFSPNVLVTGKETNMPVDLIYGTPRSRIHLMFGRYCYQTKDVLMTGTLHLVILRKETGSFIDINQLLCKLCQVVGPVPS